MLTFVPILFNTSSPNTKVGSTEIAQSLFKKNDCLLCFVSIYCWEMGQLCLKGMLPSIVYMYFEIEIVIEVGIILH